MYCAPPPSPISHTYRKHFRGNTNCVLISQMPRAVIPALCGESAPIYCNCCNFLSIYLGSFCSEYRQEDKGRYFVREVTASWVPTQVPVGSCPIYSMGAATSCTRATWFLPLSVKLLCFCLIGIRGEINVLVKVDLFNDLNRFRQSSCGVKFFCSKYPNLSVCMLDGFGFLLLVLVLSLVLSVCLCVCVRQRLCSKNICTVKILWCVCVCLSICFVCTHSYIYPAVLPGCDGPWLCGGACGEWRSGVSVDRPHPNTTSI